MSRLMRWIGVMAGAMVASGCVGSEPEDLGVEVVVLPTVYGPRDTQQLYEAEAPIAAALFDAEVMLMSRSSGELQAVEGGYSITGAPTLAEWLSGAYGYPLCTTEPYADEPTPGFCSGVLVGPDLIATAGHCVTRKSECADTAFVFGYNVPSPSGGPVTWLDADDVYRCASIVARVQTSTEDWALLRTERVVSGHSPLPVRRSGAIALGAEVLVIGHPVGLPTKLADNATVLANDHAKYFEANVDVYAGNSGSAVVSPDGLVEGILVRGNADWRLGEEGGESCITSIVCEDSGCTGAAGSGWEEVTRATLFASKIPLPAVCGNGTCETGEDCDTCAADCCVECLPAGTACAADAECCSGTCHPKKHTCR